MQVVICADVHLDGKNTGTKQNERDCFLRVIKQVQETQASLLLIAGDLFEADKVTEETLQFLKQAFEMIPDTYIFIAPGNNDLATPTSPYVQEEWSENVFVFTGNLEAVELALPETDEKIRVYGMNYQNAQTVAKTLSPENFPELDPNYINILLMHGMPDPERLNGCGFDFCALGHIHNFSGVVTLVKTAYAYPGACEGRAFNQEGGILVGTLSKGVRDLTFVDVATLHYREVSLDVSQMQSQEEILQSILQHFTETHDRYRLTLIGTPSLNSKFSLAQLKEALIPHYPHMQVRARFSRDGSQVQPLISGELADYVVKEAAYASTKEDPELMRLALEYALSVCPRSPHTPEEVYSREEFPGHED
mgnify:CR=1 FL=1